MQERQLILDKTAGGLDVFTHYLGDGCKNRLFRNPYRQDGTPSCKLYYNKERGKYIMKDYGDSQWRGDCFWFVAKISQLNLTSDFNEVLHIIDKELDLLIFDDTFSVQKDIMRQVHKVDEPRISGSLTANVTYQRMPQHEQAYWLLYGITDKVLDCYHVKSVYNARFTRADGTTFNVATSIQQKVFAYLFNDGQGQKFYRPGAEKCRFLYAGKLPFPYIFGWEQLPAKGDVVYITGGEKDVMALAAHGFAAISLNSETAMLREATAKDLLGRFDRIVFLYDCDETGLRESSLRVSEASALAGGAGRVSRIVLPLSGSKQQKDISDFFLLKHTAQELDLLTRKSIMTN